MVSLPEQQGRCDRADAITHAQRHRRAALPRPADKCPARWATWSQLAGDVIGAASIIALPFLLLTLIWGFRS